MGTTTLSKLKTFRRENNEKLTWIKSTMKSLEEAVEKMGEHLTETDSRINQAEERSACLAWLLSYLFHC